MCITLNVSYFTILTFKYIHFPEISELSVCACFTFELYFLKQYIIIIFVVLPISFFFLNKKSKVCPDEMTLITLLQQ